MEIFTTRPDTLWGATFMVIAPEHPLVDKLVTDDKSREEVEAYKEAAARQSDIERESTSKRKNRCIQWRLCYQSCQWRTNPDLDR